MDTITSFLIAVLDTVCEIPVLNVTFTCFFLFASYWYLTPKHVVTELTDIGYDHLYKDARTRGIKKNKVQIVDDSRRKRKVGKVPPVYPNGWYVLLNSDEVKTGDVKHVAALGEQFAIFRGEDGKINVVDAICPHLGANLAVDGTIKGNCIECPFHGWLFDGASGKCVSIPYTKTVPSDAKLKVWHSRELNSLVLVWYHAEDIHPTWYPQIESRIHNRKWRYGGRREYYINAHIEDLIKNDSDPMHMPHTHSPFIFVGYDDFFNMKDWWPKYVKYVFENPTWTAHTEAGQEHVSTTKFSLVISLMDKYKCLPTKVVSSQFGPGYVVMKTYTFFGPVTILISMTPVEPLLQKMIFKYFYPYSMTIPGPSFCYLSSKLIERDIPIWNHKRYLENTVLTENDDGIIEYCRWYQQFYSEHSPKYKRDSLDW